MTAGTTEEEFVCATKELQEKPPEDLLPSTNQPIKGASTELESNAYDAQEENNLQQKLYFPRDESIEATSRTSGWLIGLGLGIGFGILYCGSKRGAHLIDGKHFDKECKGVLQMTELA